MYQQSLLLKNHDLKSKPKNGDALMWRQTFSVALAICQPSLRKTIMAGVNSVKINE